MLQTLKGRSWDRDPSKCSSGDGSPGDRLSSSQLRMGKNNLHQQVVFPHPYAFVPEITSVYFKKKLLQETIPSPPQLFSIVNRLI